MSTRSPITTRIPSPETGHERGETPDALWATADGLGEHRLIFTDPASGGVHLYAGISEAGLPSMLAARLRVEDRHITEIETSVLRRNADDPAMDSFAVDRQIWSEVVPESRRVSREAVIDVADSYFEGITGHLRGDKLHT